MKEKIHDAIFGLAIGDAVGVPVEFTQTHILYEHPVSDMLGGGSHGQPKGTWSDDTSLALTLLDGLAGSEETPDYSLIMANSLAWLDKAEYTATDTVFDVGKTCLKSIANYARGMDPLKCGQSGEYDCGNGALMRILPALFWCEAKYGYGFIEKPEARQVIHNITALTHGHERCLVASGMYLAIADELLNGADKFDAVKAGFKKACTEYEKDPKFAAELPFFRLVMSENFELTPKHLMRSGGYVIETIESAIWAFLGTDNYKDCILKAVNLGHDTDTVAAVAGGLAGLYYGKSSIPEKWLQNLKKADFINALCDKYANSLGL